MAVGFGNVDNFQETIQATVDNGIDYARSKLYTGVSLKYCKECDEEIPEARRLALPGVKCCINCQTKLDSSYKEYYNRRGSKDSQLR